MTILPIVERELRVASRRPFTYRLRLRAALSAILVGGVTFFVCIGQPVTRFGMVIFFTLAILSLLYCLFAGRVATADCLSEEKRDGTLGLLFLTDLKGYDVVLGKLAATSLNGFYGMLAIFPVMAIPMLMGGVSNNQLWSMVLVLLDAFFFSLAIGMFSSSVSRDARKAMGLNFGLLFFFTLLLPGISWVIAVNGAKHVAYLQFFYASPFYPGFLCLFGPFLPARVAPPRSEFWISLATIHGLTWLLLALAAWIAPRSWQDKSIAPVRSWKGRLRGWWDNWNFGRAEHRPAFRKRLLDVNAFYWLAARARLKPLHTWALLAFLGAWWVWGRLHYGSAIWMDATTEVTMALMINATLKLWIALEAAQRLAEAQRVGSLELILSTPITVRNILRGQFLALRRQFLGPLIVALALEPMLIRWFDQSLPRPAADLDAWWWACIFFLPVDMLTLAWVAMSRSLTAKNFNQAIISTVACILILPWVAFGLVVLFTQLWCILTSNSSEMPNWPYYLYWWMGLSLATNLFFALRARAVLYRMRDIAMKRFVGSPYLQPEVASKPKAARKNEGNVFPDAVIGRTSSEPVATPPRKPRFKKRLAYALVLIAILFCAAFFLRSPRPKYPPPVIVPLSLAKGVPRVFPSDFGNNGAFFLLSDGSLWRWGGALNNSAIATVPERIATNTNWKMLCPSMNGYVGVGGDGTLWEADADGKLRQMDASHEWLEARSMGVQWMSVALKKDGTLWGWGNLGSLMGKNWRHFETNLMQLTTNSDIATVTLHGNGLMAIKRDGTLWAWGNIYINGMTPRVVNLTNLTQVCSDTNWAGFETGWRTPVRNTSNELWLPLRTTPSAGLPASLTCELAFTNAIPNRSVLAYCSRSMRYEIRLDGTLWERSWDNTTPWAPPAPDKPIGWRQRGRRRDWISLWSNGATAFGLTSDGTIWTWGVDPTRHGTDLRSRLRTLTMRLKIMMAGNRPPGTSINAMTGYKPPQFDNEPRPVMQLKPE